MEQVEIPMPELDRQNIKIRRICRYLDIDPCYATGILVSLWFAALRYRADGHFRTMDDEGVAFAIDYRGDFAQLIDALIKAEILVRDEDGWLTLVDWKRTLNRLRRTSSARRHEREKAAGGQISIEVRLMVYERDGNRCVHCQSPDDLTLDHILALANGGTHDPSNLQTLCRPCNSRKGDR